MSVEVRTDYLGIFTGAPKKIEPNPFEDIVLEETLPTDTRMGKITKIKVLDEDTVVFQRDNIELIDGPSSPDFTISGNRILDRNAINPANLETGRDIFGRKRIFTYRG